MPKVQKNLVDKVKVLADTVKEDLRKKGVVLPIKQKDGTIAFDQYLMVKKQEGFYITKQGKVIVGPINLAQTAIVTANNLALGKAVDDKLLDNDKWYGFKLFDEEVYTKSAKNGIKNKDYDKADWCFTRAGIAKSQKESYRSTILSSFNRLKLS